MAEHLSGKFSPSHEIWNVRTKISYTNTHYFCYLRDNYDFSEVSFHFILNPSMNTVHVQFVIQKNMNKNLLIQRRSPSPAEQLKTQRELKTLLYSSTDFFNPYSWRMTWTLAVNQKFVLFSFPPSSHVLPPFWLLKLLTEEFFARASGYAQENCR